MLFWTQNIIKQMYEIRLMVGPMLKRLQKKSYIKLIFLVFSIVKYVCLFVVVASVIIIVVVVAVAVVIVFFIRCFSIVILECIVSIFFSTSSTVTKHSFVVPVYIVCVLFFSDH